MVWNTENSPLYRTVESFNSRAEQIPPQPAGEPEEAFSAQHCDCPSPAPRQYQTGNGGFLQRLTSDRDSLLIIALIVLLLHEKADMKLIAALAFILLT